jgi:hypothetical protein
LIKTLIPIIQHQIQQDLTMKQPIQPVKIKQIIHKKKKN